MSSLFAFPGQGAQKPGMLHRLPETPEVAATLAEASAVLGEDALALDSAQALRSTRAVQLCLLIAGVAGARLLMRGGLRPDYVAGLSIGAYAAAVTAEALDYADALRLVALRGELMQRAYPEGYGMTAILGLEQSRVEALIDGLNGPASPLYLGNINADNQFVVAGQDAALAELARRAKTVGAAAACRLAMSVPSHCALLEQPAAQLAEAFADVSLRAPRLRYLSGTSARLLMDAERLRDDLAFNMCRRIDWHATLRTAYERGVRLHIEMPPGTVLTGLARRVIKQGTLATFDGARLDTLDALLRQEVGRTE